MTHRAEGDPVENLDPAPTEPAGPTGAGEPTEPTAPAEATEPSEPADAGEPAAAAAPGEPAEPAEPDGGELAAQLEERTADLQRLQAEFLNYKRRVERDREMLEQQATFRVLTPIIEVLDAIDRAREHGDLDPGFLAVADQLERAVAKLGLTRFGEVGDAFDPNLHDALSHIGEDPDVEVTTCKVIAKAGYRIGDRVLRPAQVLVVDPASA